MGPWQLVRRSLLGVVRRVRFAVSEFLGHPYEALRRVLFGARDRVDDGLETSATWWQRIWEAAPGDGSEEQPFPHRRARGLVAALPVGVLHVLLVVASPPDWSPWYRTGLLVAVYLLMRVVLRSVQPLVPRDPVGWFLADAGRRAGMLWWERAGAFLSVVVVVAGAVRADPAVVTVGVVVLVGLLPLLAAELDERVSERRAPRLPVSPDDADDPMPDTEGVVERVFRFGMPSEVAAGRHELTVLVDEQRYRDAQQANPVTAWVDGVPQMHRWVHHAAPEVPRVARDLRRLASESGYSTFAELQLVLAFAQSVEYVSDEETKGLSDHWQYAIETLYEQTGDCEDTTILSAAVLLAMGHQVVVLVMPEHAALGVAAPAGASGHTFRHGGVDYLYAETTAEGAVIGTLPDDVDPDGVEALAV